MTTAEPAAPIVATTLFTATVSPSRTAMSSTTPAAGEKGAPGHAGEGIDPRTRFRASCT